ncbi:MAG: glycosyltransferase [Caldilineaceae bacterium]|nr:glycosyltransferase [Caldilineaceae bacterium]
MKVLQIVYSCIPGNYRGGIAKVVYELSRAIVQVGHEVTIFTTNYNSGVLTDVPLERAVCSEGVTIQYFPVTNRRWMWSPQMRSAILNFAPQYDVIHGHNTFLALNKYVIDAKLNFRLPAFFHIHGALDPIVINKGIIRKIRKLLYIALVERRNYDAADALFAITETERRQISRFTTKPPIYIVPNGVNMPTKSPMNVSRNDFRIDLRLHDGQPVILFIGRIVPKKGVHLLIDAFARIRRKYADATLIIAGDREQHSHYVAHLDKLITQFNLANSVIWPGFVDDSRKIELFRTATVFSHVSESEGMAMSALEAMAAGLPVVVSKECYMADAARARAVIECEFNAEDLAVTLENLLFNTQFREEVGSNAQQYVREHHSWLTIAKNVVDIYQTALDKK